MRPFLILQLRPEDEASEGEYDAFLHTGGLKAAQTHRIRLDQQPLPSDLNLSAYSGVIVGGGPGCVSDAPDDKDPTEARIEAQILSVMPAITETDTPFLGCCYGIGILAHHLGARVGKDRYGEPVGPVECRMTDAARDDPVMAGLPDRFNALVGHKEAVQDLPPGAVHLLSSDPCPFQMIRVKRNIYASQFHPEADGTVFESRIRLYRNNGYFPPDRADALIATCHAAEVDQPQKILRNFVARYRS